MGFDWAWLHDKYVSGYTINSPLSNGLGSPRVKAGLDDQRSFHTVDSMIKNKNRVYKI